MSERGAARSRGFRLFLTIGTMATPLLATVTPTQMIASGEDHQPTFEIVVLTLNQHRIRLVALRHTQNTNDAPARPVMPGVRKPLS